MSRIGVAALCVGIAVALAACGQKGPLYLPDEAGTIVTRPGTPAGPQGTQTEERSQAEEADDPETARPH